MRRLADSRNSYDVAAAGLSDRRHGGDDDRNDQLNFLVDQQFQFELLSDQFFVVDHQGHEADDDDHQVCLLVVIVQ